MAYTVYPEDLVGYDASNQNQFNWRLQGNGLNSIQHAMHTRETDHAEGLLHLPDAPAKEGYIYTYQGDTCFQLKLTASITADLVSMAPDYIQERALQTAADFTAGKRTY